MGAKGKINDCDPFNLTLDEDMIKQASEIVANGNFRR